MHGPGGICPSWDLSFLQGKETRPAPCRVAETECVVLQSRERPRPGEAWQRPRRTGAEAGVDHTLTVQHLGHGSWAWAYVAHPGALEKPHVSWKNWKPRLGQGPGGWLRVPGLTAHSAAHWVGGWRGDRSGTEAGAPRKGTTGALHSVLAVGFRVRPAAEGGHSSAKWVPSHGQVPAGSRR